VEPLEKVRHQDDSNVKLSYEEFRSSTALTTVRMCERFERNSNFTSVYCQIIEMFLI
jgi:hypothetical protein